MMYGQYANFYTYRAGVSETGIPIDSKRASVRVVLEASPENLFGANTPLLLPPHK